MEVKEKIQQKLNSEFSKSVTELGTYSSSISTKLQDNNIITESSMNYKKIQFKSDSESISEVRIFTVNNICYLQSFEIKQPYQNEGLGKLIFQYVITEIAPQTKYTIYINPTNKPMKRICKKYNFSKSKKIANWYVK